MKKFNFRLQRVLEHRQRVKKESERELAASHGHLRECEDGVVSIMNAQEQCQIPDSEAMSMAELNLCGDYLNRLQETLVQQRLLVLQAVDAVDAARDKYLEKAVESEILENLKKRKRNEHNQELKRARKKELDELVVLRHRLDSGLRGSTEEDE